MHPMVEISIGNTPEISTILEYENMLIFTFFGKQFQHSVLNISEISTMLPVEISASKNSKSQFSLEKKIKSK